MSWPADFTFANASDYNWNAFSGLDYGSGSNREPVARQVFWKTTRTPYGPLKMPVYEYVEQPAVRLCHRRL